MTAKQIHPWMSDHTPETFQALGEYVFMCSTMEVSVHAVLKHMLQIDDGLVRMLVKEAAMSTLLEYLGQAAQFRKLHKDQTSALDLLRQDITYLQSVRSFVAHKPAYERPDGALIFHNTMTAPKVDGIYSYTCTATELKNGAQYGIRVITHFLDLDIRGKSEPAAYLKQVRELHSWRKKLPLPANPKDRNQQSSTPTLQLQPSWPKSGGTEE